MATALACADAGRQTSASGPVTDFVSTRDVHNFVTVMRHMTPRDSGCAWLQPYFREATAGLSAYDLHFGVHQQQLCSAILSSPARYARIDSVSASIDFAAARTDSLFQAFARIYPETRPVPVYFVVGNGISGGTTVGLLSPMVLVGVELQGSTDGIALKLLHEFIREQQHYPVLGALMSGPQFLRGNVLRHSIKEGSADFLAELVSGEIRHDAYAETREGELWTNFLRDMHGTDYSHWLYNEQYPARGNLPPNLGYWIGYRITKAFYEKAADKKRAIHDILNIQDFDEFLKRSGYHGPR